MKIKIITFALIFSLSLSPLFSSQKNPAPYSEKQYLELLSQGEKLRIEGEYDKSLISYEKSFALAREIGPEELEIMPLVKMALLTWNLGQLKESTDFYIKALALAKKMGIKESEEDCLQAINIYQLYNQAKEFRSAGDYQKSLDSLNKAIGLARKIKSQEHELKCLRQMSLTYWELNNLQKFLSLNEKALKIAEALNHAKEKGNCFNNLGIFYWKIDNYSKALIYYENALEIAQKMKNIQNETDCLNNIGIIYREIGNYDKALEYLTKALAIDQKFLSDDYISIDLNNIGTIFRKKGLLSNKKEDFYKALNYFEDCLNILRKIHDQKTEIRVLNNMGTIYSDIENYSEALKYYRLGLRTAENIKDDEARSMILNNIGIVHFNLGNYEESTNFFQKAIDIALEIRDGQVLWEAYLEIANSYKKQKMFDDSLKNYKNSISIIEDTRSTIELEEYKASYLGTDKRIEAYHNLIDLLTALQQSGQKKPYFVEAFNYLERAKARAFLDSLEVSEVSISQGVDIKLLNQEKQINKEISDLYRKLLSPELTAEQKIKINENIRDCENQYERLKREIRTTSPAYANLKYPEIIALEEAQSLLDRQTAFFAYTIGKESSSAFVISKNDFKIFPISPRKEVQKKVTAYLKAISDKENLDFHLGFELFQELVQPGLSDKIQKIIFIPDDILYFLPFETLLIQPEKDRWLIKKFTIAYAPSISSLREIIKRRHLQNRKPQKDLLAFGDPSYGVNEVNTGEKTTDIFQNFYSSSAFKFFRLKYSGLEIEKVASHFKKKKRDVFQREKATEKELKNINLTDYKIIHFAAHGLIDDQKPTRSALVLSLNQDSSEDGFVQMREIYNLRINSDLVALSACQTGLGQFIRGEGIEGLNRAFFYAGASSVLMSLWAVNDEASYQLMERFYYHLRSAQSTMNALRRAKLELIHSRVLSHPYYWAGFVITGNTDQIIFPRKMGKWLLLILSLCAAGIIFVRVIFTKKRKFLS